jgi:hypothetical protein
VEKAESREWEYNGIQRSTTESRRMRIEVSCRKEYRRVQKSIRTRMEQVLVIYEVGRLAKAL